ncbi:MAG: CPBP family intramembrane metalloprotease [Candidatus Helarchaeota archaeon]|nr:CPBP family intramembrane metalloprotease [Candidatus Helarchaeota archaeon]
MVIIIFISLIIFFLFDFGWIIPPNPLVSIGTTPVNSIPILPVLNSFILLIFLYFWVYHIPHEELKNYENEELKSIIKVFLLIFSIIMFFRTAVLLRYGLPYEKTPMIFFIGLQIIFVECYYLSNFGFHRDKIWKNIAFTFILLFIVGILFVGIIGIIVLGLSLIGMIDLNLLFGTPVSINLYGLASFPFQLICVGVSEELLFRGYFYTKLRSTNLGYIRSILVSSIFFGLFHVCWYISPQSPWFISDFEQMVYHVGFTFIFGVMMCIIFERTRSLVAPLIIHGLGNSLGSSISISNLFEFSFGGITFGGISIGGLTPSAEIWLIILAASAIIPMFFIFVIWILPRITKWIGVETNSYPN